MSIIDHNTIEDKEVFEGVFSRQLLNSEIGGSKSITVGELKIKPGAVLPMHIHNVEEALVVIEGQGQVTMEGQTFDFKADNTIHVEAGKKHQIQNNGTEMLKIFYSFPEVNVERTLI